MHISNHRALCASLVVAGLLATASTGIRAAESADKPPEAKRTILDRHDQEGVAGKEIVLGTRISKGREDRLAHAFRR